MVSYPAPAVPHAELDGHFSISSVSSWHEDPDSLGSNTLTSLATVLQIATMLLCYCATMLLCHKQKLPGKYASLPPWSHGRAQLTTSGQPKSYKYTCWLGDVATRCMQVPKVVQTTYIISLMYMQHNMCIHKNRRGLHTTHGPIL